MRQIPPAFTLLPQQFRLINATEGFRLEVSSGCLWLTRPGDLVDRFLVTGSMIELHENQVLIQSDRQPGVAGDTSASYLLVPLTECVAPRRKLPLQRWMNRWLAAPQGVRALLNS